MTLINSPNEKGLKNSGNHCEAPYPFTPLIIIIIIIIIKIFIQEAPLTTVVFREVLKIKLME